MKRSGTELGWVYAIGYADGDGPIKIGYATDCRARLASLQTGTHEKLTLWDSIPGTLETERAFHKALASLKIAREWFRRGDIVRHAFDNVRERMMDLAEVEWAADDDPVHMGIDDYYETTPADPEIVKREVAHTILYYDYVARTGDDNLEADDPVAVVLRLQAGDPPLGA